MNEKKYTEADLLHAWKEMSAIRFNNKKLEKQKIMNAIQSKSQLTIVALKRGLKSKIKWSLITIPFLMIFALLNYDYDVNIFLNGDDFWMLFLISISTFMMSLFLYYKSRKINEDYSNQASLLETLKTNLKTVKEALFIERLFGYVSLFVLFIYYIYIRLSFARPLLETIIAIAIGGIVFVLLVIWAEYRNHKKFGKHIKALEENIIRLETLQ